MEQTHDYITVKEVAAMLKCSVDSIWRKLRKGQFPEPSRKIGTRWNKQEVTTWMNTP